MRAVFKTRGVWYLCKVTEEEPTPERFTRNGKTDFIALDLAMKNYEIEKATARRHAVRVNNDWLLNKMFPSAKDNELIFVEITTSTTIHKIARLETSQASNHTNKRKGGKMR